MLNLQTLQIGLFPLAQSDRSVLHISHQSFNTDNHRSLTPILAVQQPCFLIIIVIVIITMIIRLLFLLYSLLCKTIELVKTGIMGSLYMVGTVRVRVSSQPALLDHPPFSLSLSTCGHYSSQVLHPSHIQHCLWNVLNSTYTFSVPHHHYQ